MPTIGSTQSSVALEAYSRIANERTEQLRAQQAVRAAKASQNARVRERSIGFSIGKFAVDFTTRDVEIDTDALARDAGGSRRESFDADLEAAALLQSATTPRTATGGQSAAPDKSNLTRLKALQAYAEASLTTTATQTATPGRSIGSV